MLFICTFALLSVALSQPSSGIQYSVLYPHVQCCAHGAVLQAICTGCVQSGSPRTVQLLAGRSSTFHWPVPWETWLENTTAAVEFRLEKCFGQSWLQVQRGEPFGSSVQFNTSWGREINIVRHTIDHGNFWIRVIAQTAAEADLIVATKGISLRFIGVTQQIILALAGPLKPWLPSNASISLEPYLEDEPPQSNSDPLSLLLSFSTHAAAAGQQYRVFQADAPIGGTSGCGTSAPVHECITSTVCGVERAMQALSPWTTFAPGQTHSILLPSLKQGSRKVFQVMTRDAQGRKRVYRAVSAVPVYEESRPAHSSDTIVLVSGSIAGVLLLLLLTLVVAKLRLDLLLVERVQQRERLIEQRLERKLQQGTQSPRRKQTPRQRPPLSGVGGPLPLPQAVRASTHAAKHSPLPPGGMGEAKGGAPPPPSPGTRRQHSTVADPIARAHSNAASSSTPYEVNRGLSLQGQHGSAGGPTDPKMAWA